MIGPAFEELRENLREAAQREVELRRVRVRVRRRRTGGLLAVALFGAAAAAGAADLISQGEPVKDVKPRSDVNRPNADPRQLSVTALDGDRKWGVSVYQARNGSSCVIAGEVNGVALGEVKGGRFHPYPLDYAGQCVRPRPRDKTVDFLHRPGRTLFYGRLGRGLKELPFTVNGEPQVARPGPNGAFLFVYKGNLPPSAFKLR